MRVRFRAEAAEQYPELTVGNVYLYPSKCFDVVEPAFPTDWVVVRGDAGELYASPPELSAPGFFEDVFDGNDDAQLTFRRHLAAAFRGPGRT